MYVYKSLRRPRIPVARKEQRESDRGEGKHGKREEQGSEVKMCEYWSGMTSCNPCYVWFVCMMMNIPGKSNRTSTVLATVLFLLHVKPLSILTKKQSHLSGKVWEPSGKNIKVV